MNIPYNIRDIKIDRQKLLILKFSLNPLFIFSHWPLSLILFHWSLRFGTRSSWQWIYCEYTPITVQYLFLPPSVLHPPLLCLFRPHVGSHVCRGTCRNDWRVRFISRDEFFQQEQELFSGQTDGCLTLHLNARLHFNSFQSGFIGHIFGSPSSPAYMTLMVYRGASV